MPCSVQPTLIVAAAVLLDAHRRTVLLTQRKAGSHLAGSWEFPGGKVEPGEDPRDGLTRELREELGIEVVVGGIFDVVFHPYPNRPVLLLFYLAQLMPNSPAPAPLDVAALQWAGAAQVRLLELPPADARVIDKVAALLAAQE